MTSKILLKLLFFVTTPWVDAVPQGAVLPEHRASNGLQQTLNGDRPYESTTWPSTILSYLHAGLAEILDSVSSQERTALKHDTCSAREAKSYTDQHLVRFNISSAEEAERLVEASVQSSLDLWDASSNHVDVRLCTEDISSLLLLLPDGPQKPHTTLLNSEDFAQAVASTFSRLHTVGASDASDHREASKVDLHATDSNEFFREYRPLSVLTPWMNLLESLFPSITRMIVVGKTWEGRSIYALRVGAHLTKSSHLHGPRKTVVITGGSHAREWISISSVAYSLYNFIIAYGSDSDITTILEELDFVFVPVLNPDGYNYSWEHDRLWRKTRQPGPVPSCYGMDIGRSWSYEWEAKHLSANPCSENYAGEKAFDSVEAATFAQWLKNETPGGNMSIIGMIDLHSYSQQILMPYAFSCESSPSNEEDLEELAQGMARAIRRTYGEYYEVVSACRGDILSASTEDPLIKLASSGGSPLDWFHHELGVRHAYQIKLRDTGSYGFLLPPEMITPAGREVFNAIVYFARALTSDDTDADGGHT